MPASRLCLRASLFGATLLLGFAACPAAWAQFGPRTQVTQFAALEGTVVSVRPSMIEWTNDSKSPHYAQFNRATRIQVRGEGDSSALEPGMVVRCSVEMTRRLRPAAPIAEITRGDQLCFEVAGLGEVTCSFT